MPQYQQIPQISCMAFIGIPQYQQILQISSMAFIGIVVAWA